MRQAGQARPQPNERVSQKRTSAELTSGDPAVEVAGRGEPAGDASRVAQIEHQLEATRADLQTTVQDLEIATATVEQQRATSNDLQNILISTDVATLLLDAELNIRFFTPAAKSLFNVIASDVGRPLDDLTRRFEDEDLLSDARAVLASHAPVRREVRADDGGWFMRGMLPYRSDDSGIAGLVITFAGISEIKAAEREIEAARSYLDSIINTIRQPLVVLDEELSRHLREPLLPQHLFGRARADRGPTTRLAVDEGRLDIAGAARLPRPSPARGSEPSRIMKSTSNCRRGDVRSLLVSALEIRDEPFSHAQDPAGDRRRHRTQAAAAKRWRPPSRQAEQANLGKSRFLAAASHDLRQPLQTISLLHGMLAKQVQGRSHA